MNDLHNKFKANKSSILKEFPTLQPLDINSKSIKKKTKDVRKKIAEIQEKMYANNKYAVLICLQGMDSAGKDSLIRELFKDFNARGVVVYSFKTPSTLELKHNYLWRHYIALPERGKFNVFNRTHYENVLVTRVHPEYILNENLPGITKTSDIPSNFWNTRFEQINNFEQQIVQNGTIIFKFYLHISKEEQRKRLLRRLNKPKHLWKFSIADLNERKLWNKYLNCYEDAIQNTSKDYAPWYIIPSDNKEISRLLVAEIILEQLQKYTDIQFPDINKEVEENKNKYIHELKNEPND